jgi:immune inhibitor A
MRRFRTGAAGLALAAAITGGATLTAGAAPPEDATRGSSAPVVDELPNAAEEKRRALREVALKQVISGKAKPTKRGASTVVKLDTKAPGGEDRYVELAREKTDKIFVVLAESAPRRRASLCRSARRGPSSRTTASRPRAPSSGGPGRPTTTSRA